VSNVAFFLVLLSACGHALWNFLLKRSADKLVFMWWALVISGVFLTALWLPVRTGWGRIPPLGWLCLTGSTLFHGFYLVALTRAYGEGDLSIVYPLVRSAPVLVVIWAALFLGERFTSLGLAGIAAATAGVYLLQRCDDPARGSVFSLQTLRRRPARLALLGALLLSLGSVIDKVGVGLVHPFLYAVLFVDMMVLFFAIVVLGRRSRQGLLAQWSVHRRRLVVSGTLGVPSYALVLLAMSLSQVGYVLVVRQLSVVFGVLLGILMLRERCGALRLTAAAMICAGVVMIGLT
jgi:uncharacterized membrane protein